MSNEIALTMYAYEMAGGLRATQSTAFAFQVVITKYLLRLLGSDYCLKEDKQCACF
jgi:hypothetical protein